MFSLSSCSRWILYGKNFSLLAIFWVEYRLMLSVKANCCAKVVRLSTISKNTSKDFFTYETVTGLPVACLFLTPPVLWQRCKVFETVDSQIGFPVRVQFLKQIHFLSEVFFSITVKILIRLVSFNDNVNILKQKKKFQKKNNFGVLRLYNQNPKTLC